MEKQEIFEEEFVALVIKKIEQLGLPHNTFGAKVFGNGDSGGRIWRSVRGQNRKRSVTLNEAYIMAKVLEVDLPTLVWEAHQIANTRVKK